MVNIGGAKVNLRIHSGEELDDYFQALTDPFIQEGGGMFVPFCECAAYGVCETENLKESGEQRFIIDTDEGKPIGSSLLLEVDRQNRNAKVAIAIWDPADWGKGYGTAALKLLLKFAFEDLELHRISLHNGVFEFNERAIALYKKCGFRIEGVRRQEYFHQGRWWDVVEMAILEDDYLKMKSGD